MTPRQLYNNIAVHQITPEAVANMHCISVESVLCKCQEYDIQIPVTETEPVPEPRILVRNKINKNTPKSQKVSL